MAQLLQNVYQNSSIWVKIDVFAKLEMENLLLSSARVWKSNLSRVRVLEKFSGRLEFSTFELCKQTLRFIVLWSVLGSDFVLFWIEFESRF